MPPPTTPTTMPTMTPMTPTAFKSFRCTDKTSHLIIMASGTVVILWVLYVMVIIFRYRFIHILIETVPIVSIFVRVTCETVHLYELKYSVSYNKSK